MKYNDIINFFKIKDDGQDEINLLTNHGINADGFKALLALNDQERCHIKYALTKLSRTKEYNIYQLSRTLNTLLINYRKPNVPKLINKWIENHKRIYCDQLDSYINACQVEDEIEFIFDDKLWFLPTDQLFKALRIYKESQKEYTDPGELNTIKELLRVPIITNKYRDYEIKRFIYFSQNQYAKSFLLENSENDDIFQKYTFEQIETILEYLESLKELDPSINKFALEFLKNFNLTLFLSADKSNITIDAIKEIINLFFIDNNIHFEVNDGSAIWRYLEIMQNIPSNEELPFASKKRLIELLVQVPEDNSILNLLISSKLLIDLKWDLIVDIYKEIASKPIKNKGCRDLIYNALDDFFENNYFFVQENNDKIYKKMLEKINVVEYQMTIEEYLKTAWSINDLLEKVAENNIDDVELSTEIKIYRYHNGDE